jgi:deazaflavin-dependent oxidoreductase (nitroreductase family)
MPAARRNAFTEVFFRIHPWIYRKSGGRLLTRIDGNPILLLNTRGRRSGLPRTNGLVYVEREDGWLVAASWAGEPKDPIWYLNLMTCPDITIQIKDRVIPVRARNLEGKDRDLGWKEIVAQDPSFAAYEERTRGVREIPVVLLEARDAA